MGEIITALVVLCFSVGVAGYCITSAWMTGPILNRMPGPHEKYMPPMVRKIYNFCFWLLIGASVTGVGLDATTRWLGIR